ncbi:hypothetical protein BN946_scf184836.g56 [Trametes cinnabarina]|uniref:Uncharacterized protein n=1 Tax=Pycnoporus cinnabarinus TaxID=5643 RepID=A0A060S670_PYCCI|nr:hypothetical protein BN946_scf184836.g56 [Trametes cinnabarina]
MHTPAPELAPRASDSTGSPTSSAPSSTSDSPFFPSPTPSDCASCTAEDSKSLQFTKDVLPRYQDIAAGCVPGSARAASAPVGLPPALPSPADASGRAGDEGQMVGIGTVLMGRRPNGDGGTSDTDPLVNRTMSEDHGHGHGPGHGEHAYPPPTSSAGSHEGWHDDPRRHD